MYLIKSLFYWLNKKIFICFHQKKMYDIFHIIKQTKLNVDFIIQYLEGNYHSKQYNKNLFFYYMLQDCFIRNYSSGRHHDIFHIYFKDHDLFLIFQQFRGFTRDQEDVVEIHVSSKNNSYSYIEQYLEKGDNLDFNFVDYHYFFKQNLLENIKTRWMDFYSQTERVCQFINKLNYLENGYLEDDNSPFNYSEQDLIEKYCLFLPTELSKSILNHYLLSMYCHQIECGCDRYDRKLKDLKNYVELCDNEQIFPFNSHDLIYRIYPHRSDWIHAFNQKIQYIESNINTIYLYSRLGSQLNEKKETHSKLVKV